MTIKAKLNEILVAFAHWEPDHGSYVYGAEKNIPRMARLLLAMERKDAARDAIQYDRPEHFTLRWNQDKTLQTAAAEVECLKREEWT